LCSLSLSLLAALRSTPRTNLVGRPLLCNDPATPVSYTLSLHDALPICAVDIQYWFFYPYNDWVASVNHEADWEHITVVASGDGTDRKSTRLNSSHVKISYAVFCLKKKTYQQQLQ